MAITEAIITFFSAYTPFLAFLAGLVLGDMMILLGILAGAGKANFFIIILMAFIGGLIHDTIFYFISNSRFANLLKKKLKLSKKKNIIANFIEKMGGGLCG